MERTFSSQRYISEAPEDLSVAGSTLYGSKTWTLKATNVNKLMSFKTICCRQALHISWTDDKSNESVLEEMGMQRQFIVTIRKRKLQYFGHGASWCRTSACTSWRNTSMAGDQGEDQDEAGLMTLEIRRRKCWQSSWSWQGKGDSGTHSCICPWSPILNNSDEGEAKKINKGNLYTP